MRDWGVKHFDKKCKELKDVNITWPMKFVFLFPTLVSYKDNRYMYEDIYKEGLTIFFPKGKYPKNKWLDSSSWKYLLHL